MDDICAGLRFLNLAGKVVCLHSRLKSFGWVGAPDDYANYGVAKDIVRAFLDLGCTLVVPTYTLKFECPPPAGSGPEQNGWDEDTAEGWFYNEFSRDQWQEHWKIEGYSRRTWLIDVKSMGMVPYAVIRWPRRSRGNHPLQSFAAVGPRATEVVARQRPMAPHAHFDLVDTVLMMGTSFERLTLVHYAEILAGRRPFRRWALSGAGRISPVLLDGCSEGFGRLEPVLRPRGQEIYVGDSRWIALPAPQALVAAAAAIRAGANLTHCADARCVRCNDMAAGGPVPGTSASAPPVPEDLDTMRSWRRSRRAAR
jgi:aminoglycoside 3-N-acetyltransferase